MRATGRLGEWIHPLSIARTVCELLGRKRQRAFEEPRVGCARLLDIFAPTRECAAFGNCNHSIPEVKRRRVYGSSSAWAFEHNAAACDSIKPVKVAGIRKRSQVRHRDRECFNIARRYGKRSLEVVGQVLFPVIGNHSRYSILPVIKDQFQ